MKYYCESFHLIDKGNGAEAPYDMGGKSRKHNWTPKIIFRLINMTMINAYRIYKALVLTRTPDRQLLCISRRANDELAEQAKQKGAPLTQWTQDLADTTGAADDQYSGCTARNRLVHVQSIEKSFPRSQRRQRQHLFSYHVCVYQTHVHDVESL